MGAANAASGADKNNVSVVRPGFPAVFPQNHATVGAICNHDGNTNGCRRSPIAAASRSHMRIPAAPICFSSAI